MILAMLENILGAGSIFTAYRFHNNSRLLIFTFFLLHINYDNFIKLLIKKKHIWASVP